MSQQITVIAHEIFCNAEYRSHHDQSRAAVQGVNVSPPDSMASRDRGRIFPSEAVVKHDSHRDENSEVDDLGEETNYDDIFSNV